MTALLHRLRRRGGDEGGFTLMELLVVMLILAVLMAIAVVAFLNQREKAEDSQAKSTVRTLMTAMEACANEKGSYTPCNIAAVRTFEKTIPQTGSTVDAQPTGGNSYIVTAVSPGGNSYQLRRNDDGSLDRLCIVPPNNNPGGCNQGSW